MNGPGLSSQLHSRTTYWAIAFALALLSACGPQRKGPKRISAPVYDAFVTAMDAVARANEYRDAGVLLYEPRFLEVERARDELKERVRNSKLTDMDAVNEMGTWMTCDICITALKAYRIASANLDHISNPVLHPDAGYLKELAARQQSVQDAGKAIDACIKRADEYLH